MTKTTLKPNYTLKPYDYQTKTKLQRNEQSKLKPNYNQTKTKLNQTENQLDARY